MAKKLYFNVSYDGSPVGFQLGCITLNSELSEMREPGESKMDRFIRSMFDSGLVNFSFGEIPKEITGIQRSVYFVLSKRTKLKDEEGRTWYISMCYVDSDAPSVQSLREWWMETSLLNSTRISEDVRKDILKSLFIIDKFNTFGYTINQKYLSFYKMHAFLVNENINLRDISMVVGKKETEKYYIIFSSNTKGVENLWNEYSEDSFYTNEKRISVNEKTTVVRYGKKKKNIKNFLERISRK